MPRRKLQVDALLELTTAALRQKYAEVLGEAPRSKNKGYLARSITRRLQEMARECRSDVDRERDESGEVAS